MYRYKEDDEDPKDLKIDENMIEQLMGRTLMEVGMRLGSSFLHDIVEAAATRLYMHSRGMITVSNMENFDKSLKQLSDMMILHFEQRIQEMEDDEKSLTKDQDKPD